MKSELQMHWILQKKPVATQRRQRNLTAAAAVQEVVVVAAEVVHQMPQTLAVLAEQAEVLMIQMGQMCSEQGLLAVFQMHWMKQSHLAVAEIQIDLKTK